jgi:hypothetical protein
MRKFIDTLVGIVAIMIIIYTVTILFYSLIPKDYYGEWGSLEYKSVTEDNRLLFISNGELKKPLIISYYDYLMCYNESRGVFFEYSAQYRPPEKKEPIKYEDYPFYYDGVFPYDIQCYLASKACGHLPLIPPRCDTIRTDVFIANYEK